MRLNTAIFYKYNKFDGGVRYSFSILPGSITEEEKKNLIAHLAYGDCFLPNLVGLPALNKDIPDSIDSFFEYSWHILDDIFLTELKATHTVDIHTFVKEFLKVIWLPDKPFRSVPT